jgi:hypothetical protein
MLKTILSGKFYLVLRSSIMSVLGRYVSETLKRRSGLKINPVRRAPKQDNHLNEK